MSLLVAGNNPAAVKTAERNIFTATASQTTFTITQGYQAGDIDVFLNGVRLVDTEDYVANNGTTVVLNSGAAVGDSVVVVCFRPFQVADFYTKSEQDTRYVNATGDNLVGSTFQLSSFINLQANDANGYPRINGAGSSAQLGLFRSSGGSEGGMFIGANASEFAVWDQNFTRRLIVDQSGRVTMPYQPAFMANLSADWTHTSGVLKVAGTFSADVNTGSNYSTSTKRFTAPVTGNYFISASVSTVGGAGAFSYLSSEIWVNGIRRIVGGWDGGGTSYGNTSVSGVVSLNANDYVELYCEANKTFTMASGSGYSFLSGHLIG